MEENQALEVEYTPSLFSKRFENRDELFSHYLEFSLKESEKNRKKYDCHLNIAYGESAKQKLDIYGDNLSADSPLFVFVHGGYWQMCDKWMSSLFVGPLVESGIRVVVVGYDLCPTVTLAQIVDQVQRSFTWVSGYVAKNSIKSVSFAGHSAGGQLLACSLTKDFIESIAADVKLFAYYFSGVYDLQELYLLKAANDNNILSLDKKAARELSPQFYAFDHFVNRSMKNYVWVGEHESAKFKEQSKNFAESALKDSKSVTYEVIAGLDHFDIIETLSQADNPLTCEIIKNATQA